MGAGAFSVLTHADLCDLALTWLRRQPTSSIVDGVVLQSGGAGCAVAASEISTGAGGEEPDAIGFTTAGISHLIECKASRSDFMRDRHKPWRRSPLAIGHYRWFLCPRGMVAPHELPDGWGLISVAGCTRLHRVVQATWQKADLQCDVAALVRIARTIYGAGKHREALRLGRSRYSVRPFWHHTTGLVATEEPAETAEPVEER